MAEMTREEADAKIGQTEARLEARVAEVRGDIKVISHKIDTLVSEVSASRVDTRDQNRSTRTTVIITAIAAVIGLWAAMMQLQSGLMDAFQTGLSVVQSVHPPAEGK